MKKRTINMKRGQILLRDFGKRQTRSESYVLIMLALLCVCVFLVYKLIFSLLSDYQTEYPQIFASPGFQPGEIIGIFLFHDPPSKS